ncbi:major outer membrane protein FomA [Fusobacterium ulcerans]|uniref:major outer membrane protein FomA n=1 Tax=Fusobacterium ulcerans TaxID=861 RepID=UPI00241DABC9|nr:hypothetical protein [Fusobacterium ulcerans]
MRKLALLLGSLLVVASASAKEVVPAPVVVEEAPVQVIEKEVIVYRDKEEGFRPNGYVDLQYRYYGKPEEQKFYDDGVASNYGRIQLLGKINMTEKQALEYRVRSYNDWNDVDSSKEKGLSTTQTRLRYFYDHGLLGDSKVDFTSRIHYLHDYDNTQEAEYEARFNFVDYMFNNDYVKMTDFTLAPMYRYSWASNSQDYDNQLGLNLYTNTKLPLGFNLELNFYATQHFYGKDQLFDNGRDKDDKNFTVDMELYLTNEVAIYSTENSKVELTFDGGYDPYNWSQKEMFGDTWRSEKTYNDDNSKEYLYAKLGVKYTYNVNSNITTFAHVQGEYANQKYKNENSARDWRWRPLVTVGVKTTF